MAELTLVEAINDGFHVELGRDDSVMVMGEDVGRAEEVRAEAQELMRRGIAQAEAEPPPDPELLFAHAYADPPASFGSDLEELRRILGG